MEELKSRKFLQVAIGFIGITLIIVIHEMGHFLACKLFNVSTPIFSIGFGPALLQIPIKTTIFQLCLLPLGGYVSIDQTQLELQPYVHVFIILIAGIMFNIISAAAGFIYLRITKPAENDETKQQATQIKDFMQDYKGLIGPIGIIKLIGASLFLGHRFFIFILAIVSLNIAFFNLLPISFLDGGQIIIIGLKRMLGAEYAESAYLLFMIICMLSIAAMFYAKKRKATI